MRTRTFRNSNGVPVTLDRDEIGGAVTIGHDEHGELLRVTHRTGTIDIRSNPLEFAGWLTE